MRESPSLYPAGAFARVADLFTTTGPHRLVLITYGGSFETTTRNYQDNIVILASPQPQQPGRQLSTASQASRRFHSRGLSPPRRPLPRRAVEWGNYRVHV